MKTKKTQIDNIVKSKKFYNNFLAYLSELIDFEHCSIYYFDSDNQKLVEAINTGKRVDLIPEISFKFGYGLSAWNAKKKKILVINELDSHNVNRDIVIKSFLSLPLALDKKILGIINFSNSKENSFDKKVVKLLKMMMQLFTEILQSYLTISNQKKEISDLKKKI
jgi:putative methionine-R-sulfoxide reductase with GAF domain